MYRLWIGKGVSTAPMPLARVIELARSNARSLRQDVDLPNSAAVDLLADLRGERDREDAQILLRG